MTVRLYMDHHVPGAITAALRERGADVLTAHEDGAAELSDDILLQRASALGRALFSRDHDLLREASLLQRAGAAFSGVIYAHQLRLSIGACVEDLALIARAGDAEDVADRVTFLPL
jgi:hypothetical protein